MRLLIVLTFAVSFACGCKDPENGGAGSSEIKGAETTPVEATRPPPQIDCEKAIPKELIARHMPNATTEWAAPFDNGSGSFISSCRFIDDAVKGRTIVRYKCGPSFADLEEFRRAVEPHIKADDGGKFEFGRVDGIGRGGLRDKRTVVALHRDMPCIIEVDELGDREPPDWAAFLKDLEEALTPAASTSATP